MAMAQALREEGDRQLKLRNVAVSTVKPSERTDHAEKQDVALLDMYLPDMYMPILLIFRPGREDGKKITSSQFVTRMKHSLSRVLVPYYPFAGRGVKTYDLRIRELVFNDEGVPFIEAEVDEEMEKVINIDDFQPLPILSGYQFVDLDSHSFYQVNAEFPLPACFIQVTKFKCGGISVNVSFLHIVGDGKAMFQFLKAWSQVTLSLDDQIEPLHDRSLTHPLSVVLDMMATAPPTEPDGSVNETSQTRNHEALPVDDKNTVEREQDQTNELNISLQKSRLDEAAPVPSSTKSTAEDGKEHTKSTANGNAAAVSGGVDMGEEFRFPLISEWTFKTLHVRREIVQKLKEEAKNRNDGFVPTALDCIQSYLWRGLARVPSSIDGRKSTVFGVVLEGRRRLHDPPIRESYTGNALLLYYTPELQQPSSDPLVEAGIIQQMVRSVTPDSWLPILGRALSILKNVESIDERPLFASSWYRFPVYETDFGYGAPVYATCNIRGAPPYCGYAMILPPRPGSNHLASVQLIIAPQILQPLLNDPEFRSLFH